MGLLTDSDVIKCPFRDHLQFFHLDFDDQVPSTVFRINTFRSVYENIYFNNLVLGEGMPESRRSLGNVQICEGNLQ